MPQYVISGFVATTIATLLLFYWTISESKLAETRKKSWSIMICLIIWLIVQAILTLSDFYKSDPVSLPPPIAVTGILPPLLTIATLFATSGGRKFIDALPLKNITYLHTVRIPVETVLFWLFLNKAVPELMTFDGRNFDIIAGITAPLIAYFGFTRKKMSRNILLVWNVVCLLLLMNIVINAMLSTPSPFQQFGFDQPNIAILNFPFSWLPTFIVPIVLFAHLTAIRQLISSRRES